MRPQLITLLGLTGCDVVFGLRTREIDAGAPADVAVDAIDAMSCITPAVSEPFDTPMGEPCIAFGGFNNSNVSYVIQNGALEITPDPTVSSSIGGCIAIVATPFTPAGVFAEISAVGTGEKEYTVLYAHWEGASETSAFVSNGSALSYGRGGETFGSVPYDSTSTRWWRMRPSPEGIIGEYSPNGVTWTRLGVDPATAPARIRVEFDIGTYAVEPTAGTAVFQGINVCP